jgi:hypothetical protein
MSVFDMPSTELTQAFQTPFFSTISNKNRQPLFLKPAITFTTAPTKTAFEPQLIQISQGLGLKSPNFSQYKTS